MLVEIWTHPSGDRPRHPCNICNDLRNLFWAAGTGPRPPIHKNCDCELRVEEWEIGADPFDWTLLGALALRHLISILSDYSYQDEPFPDWVPDWLRSLAREHAEERRAKQQEDGVEEQRVRLAGTGQRTGPGEFEILAITAGEGNGWNFSEQVLVDSLSLWNGADCFVDHGGWWGGRSVRDLGGVCYDPEWDAAAMGVRVKLRACGPSGALVDAVGREMIDESDHKPDVGFSADVMFTATGSDVVQILRVYSLDLVYDPARGGAFVRALNSVAGNRRGEGTMDGKQTVPANGAPVPAPAAGTQSALAEQLNRDAEAVRTLLAVQEERDRMAIEADAARAVRAQMCVYLLESGLGAARLPAPAAERVRKQFTGKVFEPQELTEAIDDARKLVSELVGGAVVSGPGAVRAMFSSEDQLQAAVDDLLEAPRDKNMVGAKVHRLSGIRELYHMLTGDYDYHGGYYAERVRLATTNDFTGLVKNALNKIVVNQWNDLGRAGYRWWESIVAQEDFTSLQSITGTLVGTVGTLPSVAEQGEYTELVVGDSPETATFTKYGGYIPLTLELIDRDETRKLKAYPKELAKAGIRRLSSLVAAIFTDNSAVGPTLADTGALFNATAVTTVGGHANLLTTALAAAEWEVVSRAVYNQPLLIKQATGYYGTGPKMALDPKYLLVPRALRLTGMRILYPSWDGADNKHYENMQQGNMGDVITVPEWTDATDWAAACDPALSPAIFVGYRFGRQPEVFIAGDSQSPAVFMNDEHRLKVRFFLAVWVNDFRPLHKSNVAG